MQDNLCAGSTSRFFIDVSGETSAKQLDGTMVFTCQAKGVDYTVDMFGFYALDEATCKGFKGIATTSAIKRFIKTSDIIIFNMGKHCGPSFRQNLSFSIQKSVGKTTMVKVFVGK